MLWLLVVATPGRAQKPADLLPRNDSSFDANGIVLNPVWGWQRLGRRHEDIDHLCGFVAGPGLWSERPLLLQHMACTSQENLLVLNERQKPAVGGYACNQDTDEGELQGHVNWFVVSVTGHVTWQSYGRGSAEDHDVTLWLDTLPDELPPGSGVRVWQDTRIEIEFNGDEALGWAADTLPPWWRRLWTEAKNGDSIPGASIHRMPALVTGVFGLDGIHGAHPEIHPVYALALLTSAAPDTGSATRDHWAFFVRNGGNEGECSEGLLPFEALPLDPEGRLLFRFTLPWRPGADSVVAQWQRNASGVIAGSTEVDGPRMNAAAGQGVQLTFVLPKPGPDGRLAEVIGEFDLVWHGVSAEPATIRAARVEQELPAEQEHQPGKQFQEKLGPQPNAQRVAQLQLLEAERDSNTYTPKRAGRFALVIPGHDSMPAAAPLVRGTLAPFAPVPVWRRQGRNPSPPAQACRRSVPGCMTSARKGIGFGSVLTTGGRGVARVILGETRTQQVKTPLGWVPIYSIRFAVGIDRIDPPLSRAIGGATVVDASAALIVRLPQGRVIGPYLFGGLDGYFGSEAAVGASAGLGIRMRSGLPVLPFIEARRAIRVRQRDYWAWEGGVLFPLF